MLCSPGFEPGMNGAACSLGHALVAWPLEPWRLHSTVLAPLSAREKGCPMANGDDASSLHFHGAGSGAQAAAWVIPGTGLG